ncbi:MAG: hypothetical protein OEU54_09585 [Gemmatimonadota bacterium]|nr:hypothetical protein [Gemmatimonadota bacterium]
MSAESHHVQTDPDQSLTITIEGHTPHGMRHAVWFAQPGATEWTPVGRGGESDSHTIDPPVMENSQALVWTNLAGEEKEFEFSVTVSQNGASAPGGGVIETGELSQSNARAVSTHLIFE